MPLSGGDGPDSNARFSMDDRQRMLAAITGTPTDRLPWVLSMDLRLVAQRARGSRNRWSSIPWPSRVVVFGPVIPVGLQAR
jgi:hypothetical protein